MSHDTDAACACCSEHRPPYLELEGHHVHPLYLGGPADGEIAWLCGTTHTSVHELLRLILAADRPLTYHECQEAEPRPVARYAHALAVEAWTRWRASLT